MNNARGNCPRCHEPLATRHRAGVEFGHCPRCGGVRLSAEAFQKVLDANDSPPSFPGGDASESARFLDGTARCSCSDTVMLTASRGGVQIDRCPGCGALWFDGGEVQRVLAESRTDGEYTMLAERMEPVVEASHLAGLAAWILGGILKR